MAYQDEMGAVALPKLSPSGEVPTRDPEATAAETNRLLRKLIAGLELIHGQEFPEVE